MTPGGPGSETPRPADDDFVVVPKKVAQKYSSLLKTKVLIENEIAKVNQRFLDEINLTFEEAI